MLFIISFKALLISIHSDIKLGSSSKRRQRRNKQRYASLLSTSKSTISEHYYELL